MADPTRERIESFLYEDAALLDEWRLDEWLMRLTDDVRYEVPSTDDPEGDSKTALFLVADDASRLRARVKQMMGTRMWVENPRSRTRRFLSNVRIRTVGTDAIDVTANFLIDRMRREEIETFVGRYDLELTERDGELRMRKRRAVLDLEWLRPHGKVSIIL